MRKVKIQGAEQRESWLGKIRILRTADKIMEFKDLLLFFY